MSTCDLTDMPEAVLQRLLLARVNKLPGCVLWRSNVGAVKTARGMVRFGVVGQADTTGLIRGRRLEIECKRLKGGRQSPEQKAFQEMIEKFGGLYIIARDFDPTMEIIMKELEK